MTKTWYGTLVNILAKIPLITGLTLAGIVSGGIPTSRVLRADVLVLVTLVNILTARDVDQEFKIRSRSRLITGPTTTDVASCRVSAMNITSTKSGKFYTLVYVCTFLPFQFETHFTPTFFQ